MKIGILGGLGPASSAQFYSDLVKSLQKSKYVRSNTDFPHIIINSIPAPELTGSDCSDSQLQQYREGLEFFCGKSFDLVLMVCNTPHAFEKQILPSTLSSIFLSIPTVVHQYLKTHLKTADKLCVVGTYSTVKSHIYNFENFDYHTLPDEQLMSIGEIVKNFNSSGDIHSAQRRLMPIIEEARKAGVTHFLLACSEVSFCLNGRIEGSMDTMSILLNAVLEKFEAEKIA